MTRVAIVGVVWNPFGHPSLATNATRWYASAPRDPAVQIWTVQVLNHHGCSTPPPNPLAYNLTSPHHIWCIESARNALMRQICGTVDAAILMDVDLIYDSPNWWQVVLHSLDKHPLVHGFEDGVWMDRFDRPFDERKSLMWGHHNSKLQLWPASCGGRFHVGFCWAARSSLWSQGNPGIPDWVCFGANDRALALACTNHQHHQWTGWWRARLDSYTADLHRWMGSEQAGYTPLTVRHLWHGDVKNRRYSERSTRLSKVDWPKHCRYNEDGLLAWTDEGHKLHNEWFKKIMTLRQNED